MNSRIIVLVAAAVLLLARRALPVVVKDGVQIPSEVRPEMIEVFHVVSEVWADNGRPQPTLTSLVRPGAGSLHAVGLAADFRTRDLPAGLELSMASESSRRLGPRFQVIVENETKRWYYRSGRFEGFAGNKPTAPQHIHIEMDG